MCIIMLQIGEQGKAAAKHSAKCIKWSNSADLCQSQGASAPATLHGKFKYSRDWWPAPRSGGLVADPKQPKQIEHLSS